MKFTTYKLLAVSFVIAAMMSIPIESRAATQKASVSRTLHSDVTLSGEVPIAVKAHRAMLVGTKAATSQMSLSLALQPRNQRELTKFIQTRVLKGHYLSQQQFDRKFGSTPARVSSVLSWIRGSGLRLTYRSPDGLTFGVQGPTDAVERSLSVRINMYRSGSRQFYSASSEPRVPVNLGITAVVGLDNSSHAEVVGPRHAAVRDGGYYPVDYRIAYDVVNHGITGAGQDIGLTLWGPKAQDSDFAALNAHQTSDTTVTDPALKSCASCNTADTVQWIPIDGTDTSTSEDLTETSMDAEFSHGMALHSHLRFYLGKSGALQVMADTVAAAANDRKIHIVSNSWGVGAAPSTSNPFVKATTISFEHAIAVGTTFYFASGDDSENSGCPVDATTKTHTLCDQPLYPASSPYVVAVGGTNLQVNQNVTWSSESVWNSDPNDGFSGGGNGCASIFPRPKWQTGVNLAATCKGRAFPDISADGDPETGAHVFTNGGQDGTVGGTSLATPLVAGMAALTNAYLATQKEKPLGFAAPEIYKLGNSSLYNTYFHDVRCGYNGQTAGPGWDEATGFGSLDWYRFAMGVAGKAVKPVGESISSCTEITKPAQVADPFNWDDPYQFAIWPVFSENETSKKVASAYFDRSANPMKVFHSKKYASFNVQGGTLQTATVDTAGDGSYSKKATIYYLGSYTKNNYQAAALVADARKSFGKFKTTIGGPNCLVGDAFPFAPVNCYFYGLVKLPHNQVGDYIVLQEQNAVVEILGVAPKADMSDSDIGQNFLNAGSTVLTSAIDRINAETNSGFGEKY